MKKVFMYSILCGCVFLMVGCGCSKTDKDSVEKVDTDSLSGHFFENQTIDTMEIQNFNIVVENGESFISFDLKNTVAQAISVEYIKILLYDNTDYLILESYGDVGGILEASETKHITVTVDIDLSKVVRVVYERV